MAISFWSRRVLLGVLSFGSLFMAGCIWEIAQHGSEVSQISYHQLFGLGSVLFGMGYLFGMIWEHKVGFESKQYTGLQYGLAVLFAIFVAGVFGAIGYFIVNG